ncbi:MAG: hypothetical protein JRD93_12815 [Deltaproteobacteria bacterium]|nr:hypothetical protein [Deltaproteobacteria bacterium]MBW2662840.1 hypothetical protein [Deltaproteobacteria bacterium]
MSSKILDFIAFLLNINLTQKGKKISVYYEGIERQKIFYDDLDRNSFLERLGVVLTETSTPCSAEQRRR